jgi:hypothetical protein
MMNRPIEGIVTSATLVRRLARHSFWRDVTLRRADGTEVNFSRLTVATPLEAALAQGTAGKFHFHDIVGAQGLHAFSAAGRGEPVQAFPKLVEHLFAGLAVLNLALAAGWISLGGVLAPVPLTTGVLATMAWATCRGARQAVLHDLRYENRLAARRTHRAAVMHSHA